MNNNKNIKDELLLYICNMTNTIIVDPAPIPPVTFISPILAGGYMLYNGIKKSFEKKNSDK